MQQPGHPKAVVLFDGVCNLCSAAVQWIIRRDRKAYFLFASLQSEAGHRLLEQYGLPVAATPESIVLIENGKAYQQSSAVLRIAKHLSGGSKVLYPLLLIPPFIRNGIYRWIARNRYKWWGQKNECWLPSPALKQRFL